MDKRLIALLGGVKRQFVLSIALNFAAGLCLIGQALALSRVIAWAFLQGAPLADVAGLLLLAAGCALGRALLSWGAYVSAADMSIHVRAELRRRLLAHLAALGPAYTQGEQTGELTTTVTKGIDALDPYFRDYLPAILTALLVPLAILIAVVPLDGLTFFVLLVTAPLIPLFMALIGMAAGVLAKKQYAGLSRLSAHFLDVMSGLPTLKLFNREQYQVESIGYISDQFRSATMGVLRVAFLSALSLEMLATLSVAIVAVEIGIRLLHGGIGFEQALFLLVIAPEFYQPLRTLGARFHTGTEGSAAASRIFEVLETPAPEAPSNPAALPDRLHIRFEHVTYAYEGGRSALNDVNFEVLPGEHVAVVGESGSGKSTLASLLLGFLKPESGRITVDGVDLARLNPDEWRANIAWVSQSPYLFNASIAANIRLGRPEASNEEVIAAARAAEAHDFISALPEGYNTLCGERGVRLSGGQAQRIAIARAFLRDAPLLILDEFTAYLDRDTEVAVQTALRRLLYGRTALVIAHRLNTIIDMDRIIVFENGAIVETGTHDHLMQQRGSYRTFVEAEALTYAC
jgi:ATP-binding cassette subfamily C protein CydD